MLLSWFKFFNLCRPKGNDIFETENVGFFGFLFGKFYDGLRGEKCSDICQDLCSGFVTFVIDGDNCQCVNVKNFYSFIPGGLDTKLETSTMANLVSNLHGNWDNGQYKEVSNVLTADECATLRAFGDDRKNESLFDNRLEVLPAELATMLSAERIRSLHNIFLDFTEGAAVTKVIMRITSVTADEPKHVQYHNDGPFDVMHMYLNSVGGGGNLNYLTSNGEVSAKAATGHAVMHRNGIVHGVSSFLGTRYILIFMNGSQKSSTFDVIRPLYENNTTIVDEL